MNQPFSCSGLNASFAPTRWTQVLRARGNTPESQRALGELCEAYWQPIFRFLRSEGRDEDTARELTQEFFARLLAKHGLDRVDPERGRFRSYLLGAVKHFLADRRDQEHRLKRGGGISLESLELPDGNDTSPALQVADPAAMPSDHTFDREWAVAVMDRALTALQKDYAQNGNTTHFEMLKPWLEGDSADLSQAETAARLKISEGAIKVAIHRLRKHFRETIRAELAQTVNTASEIDEELRYLVDVLS
jgi:RNA polymerase sigma-70 factor (ECF subfamily)